MISEEIEPTKKAIRLESPPSSFTSLPDEIVEEILARVSRWSYPSLSLVSKKFLSLLSSTRIYKTRSRIGAQETCIYVFLWLPEHPYPSLFSLWTKPKQTLTEDRVEIMFEQDPSGTSVIPTPFSSSHSNHSIRQYDIIVVGSEFYFIGGPEGEPSTSVKILDCRDHTWRDAPYMTVAREDPSAIFLDKDNKILVMGGCCINDYFSSWIEVFDIKTQSWTSLPGPGPDDIRNDLRGNYNFAIVDMFDKKVYVATQGKDYTYDTKNGTWKVEREQSSSFLQGNISCWCELDNILIGCNDAGCLIWSVSHDTKGREWRDVKGLENLRELSIIGLKLGRGFDMVLCDRGRVLVMWDPYHDTSSGIEPAKKVWYAKISIETRSSCNNGCEVWGKVECVDMLTFPAQSYDFFCCFGVRV